MAFDPKTARPVGGFDPTTARPVEREEESRPPPEEPDVGGNYGDLLLQGMFAGGIDELAGTGAAAYRAIAGGPPGTTPEGAYRAVQGTMEQRAKNARDNLGFPGAAAEMAANIIPAAKISSSLTRAMSPGGPPWRRWLQNATMTGSESAAYGYASAEDGDRGRSAVEGGVVGAAGGAVLGEGFDLLARRRAFRQSALDDLLARRPTNDTATFRAEPSGDSYVLRPDPVGKEAVNQGIDRGVVAAIKQASPADRAAMAKMLDTVESTSRNAYAGVLNRPADVVGNTLKTRIDNIMEMNKAAAGQLDSVAEDLAGQRVDMTGPYQTLVDGLQKMGISITDEGSLDFTRSTVQMVPAGQAIMRRLWKRLDNLASGDAHEFHMLKRWIDEQVTYGKSKGGLAGEAEHLAKEFRRAIDGQLDNAFPRYNEVNTQYSDTRSVIDAFQDAAGSKLDLTGDNVGMQLGTLSRRLMSNVQTRVNLLDAIRATEEVGAKYGKTYDDDIIMQVLFVDELDSVFGPAAKTSLLGDVDKAVQRGAATSTSRGVVGFLADQASNATNYARGRNEEGAMRALRKLLEAQ